MIKEHPTWSILDASKIEEYMTCPRKYFYRYILGWQTEVPDVHRHFGTCWHKAMEIILEKGNNPDAIAEAYINFETLYREVFPAETDDTRFPKVPSVALKGLALYNNTYAEQDEGQKTLYVEVAGTVPVTTGRRLHFKMDSLVERKDGTVMTREHKTGTTLNRQWTDKWKLSLQVGTYIHVLYCLYPQEKVWGAEINGAFFKKGNKNSGGEVEFVRIPIRKTPPMMEDWLFNTLSWIELIDRDMDKLTHCSEQYEVMSAFSKNTTSCTDYFGCPYFDFCLSWSNPLQHAEEPPLGFIVQWWNPEERRQSAKKIIDLS